MTADIMPVFAGGLLETAVRALERQSVEQWQAPEILEGVGLFIQLRSTLRAARKEAERELDHGVEATGFVKRYQPVADGLARFFAAISQAREGLAREPKSAALSIEAAAVEGEGRKLHDLLSEVLQKIATPRPIDLERLKQGEADVAAGKVVRIETFEEMFGDATGAA